MVMGSTTRQTRQEHEAAIARALDAGCLAEATTRALRAYGAEIRRHLARLLRDDDAADEAFARFAEDVWRGIARFRRQSSFRTWAYRLARNCACDHLRDIRQRRVRRLDTKEASQLPARAESRMPAFLRPSVAEGFALLRGRLRPEEQALLALRLDRGLAWKEVAQTLAAGGPRASEAALRQRFDWLKKKIRKLARERGMSA
jgi:RNA polymerase sigma-70 factor (ECF subfamily)